MRDAKYKTYQTTDRDGITDTWIGCKNCGFPAEDGHDYQCDHWDPECSASGVKSYGFYADDYFECFE